MPMNTEIVDSLKVSEKVSVKDDKFTIAALFVSITITKVKKKLPKLLITCLLFFCFPEKKSTKLNLN